MSTPIAETALTTAWPRIGRRLFAGAAVMGMALTGMAVHAVPADAAGTSISVPTTDPGPQGGAGLFWHAAKGAPGWESVGACDKQNDGLRVYAEFQWKNSDGTWSFDWIEDAGGAHTCATKNIKVPEGRRVQVTACLKDGYEGTRRYCNTGSATA